MFAGDDFVVVSASSPWVGMQKSSGKVMQTGTEHTGTVISKVEALYAKLDLIREDSFEMSKDERRSYYDRLNQITEKQTALSGQLEALKTASVSSYDSIKLDIESCILDIELLLGQMRRV